MTREEYAFAWKLNGTDQSGIITLTNPPKLICLCEEKQSKIILEALNNPLHPANATAEEILKPYLIKGGDTSLMDDIFFVSRGCALHAMHEFAAQRQRLADEANKLQWSGYGPLGNISQQPTAEGAGGCSCAMPSPDRNRECCLICGRLLHEDNTTAGGAEKKLREELIKYDKWEFGETGWSEKTVDKYLKTRSHE